MFAIFFCQYFLNSLFFMLFLILIRLWLFLRFIPLFPEKSAVIKVGL